MTASQLASVLAQDMGYHIETVHSRLPSLLDQDGWTSDLRDRSITLRVQFREYSDPSLRGAICPQTLRDERPPVVRDMANKTTQGRHSLYMQDHHRRRPSPCPSLRLMS